MLKDKNILYIVHNYNTFQKDPIEEAAKHFKRVYVLVRYKPISKIVNLIPINWLKKFEDSYVIDLRDLPDNVEVIKTPVWYLPYGIFYKWAGKSHYRSVEKIIKKFDIKFDLIHSHFIWTAGYVGMKLKQKYNKPLTITAHGYDIYDIPFQSNAWRGRIAEVLNSADELLTVSNFAKSFFKSFNIKKTPHVVYNGFNERLFSNVSKQEARRKLAFPKNKKIILTIGNLEKVKGYEVLIKALNIVAKKRKDFLCIHIGAGREEKKVRGLIKKYNLEKNVKLLGKKPHHELKDWYGICDFFVSPSWSETGPVVMFESLACGKAFIGTKVGSATDVINSEDYGKLTEPGNHEELAKNIIWALDRDWDSDKISKYSKQFSWNNSVNKILKIYEKL